MSLRKFLIAPARSRSGGTGVARGLHINIRVPDIQDLAALHIQHLQHAIHRARVGLEMVCGVCPTHASIRSPKNCSISEWASASGLLVRTAF